MGFDLSSTTTTSAAAATATASSSCDDDGACFRLWKSLVAMDNSMYNNNNNNNNNNHQGHSGAGAGAASTAAVSVSVNASTPSNSNAASVSDADSTKKVVPKKVSSSPEAGLKHKRRYCKTPGCERIVKSQGLCQRHGAKPRKCSVPFCNKQAQGNFKGMCKSHFKVQEQQQQMYAETAVSSSSTQLSLLPTEYRRQVTPTLVAGTTPTGPSVYDNIIPASLCWQANNSSNGGSNVMPLVAYLQQGFERAQPPAWHRNEERRARGLVAVDHPARELDVWERELIMTEVLLLSGNASEAVFAHLALGWGRDPGFHLDVVGSLCRFKGCSGGNQQPNQHDLIGGRESQGNGMMQTMPAAATSFRLNAVSSHGNTPPSPPQGGGGGGGTGGYNQNHNNSNRAPMQPMVGASAGTNTAPRTFDANNNNMMAMMMKVMNNAGFAANDASSSSSAQQLEADIFNTPPPELKRATPMSSQFNQQQQQQQQQQSMSSSFAQPQQSQLPLPPSLPLPPAHQHNPQQQDQNQQQLQFQLQLQQFQLQQLQHHQKLLEQQQTQYCKLVEREEDYTGCVVNVEDEEDLSLDDDDLILQYYRAKGAC